MRDRLLEKTKTLMSLKGVSGHETEVVRFLKDRLSEYADSVEVDALGNIFALKKGKGKGPRFLLAAHSDEIGAVVRYIDDSGFIRFEKIGGVLDSLLVGRKVRVGQVFGVVGVRPGHYQTPEERRQVPSADSMYIDVGASSRQEVEALGIEIGTPITYEDQMSVFSDGNRFCGAALDDRAGCAVLWEVLEQVADGDFGGEFWAVVTVQEEVGLRGASVTAERVRPDFALALDTIPCGGTPDVNKSQLHTDIGKGPVFSFVSGAGGRAPVPPKIRKILVDTAEKHNLPYQPMIFRGGNNDSSAMQLAAEGIAAGSVTLPRRYSHSPVEMADLRDLETATKLLVAIVREMNGFGDFSFL